MVIRKARGRAGADISFFAVCLASTAMTAVFVPAAHAQTSGPVLEAATNIGEIIVTARKRNETLMTAPVAVQAFTSEKLEKLAINDIAAFSAIAPNLTIHYATGGVGAVAFLRGIGNGEAASFIDQSVLLNVDDVPQTHGAFMKSGLFDAEQIEVLKGPQALFFGKSASAGIISVRTADPTAEWTSSLKGSYGFTADEARTEGYIAGPLGGGFGVRVAGYYDHLDGYLHNPALSTTEPRVPHGKDYGGRITVKYDGGPTFNARLKWAQTQVSQLGNTSFSNQVRCAGATPQKPTQLGDDCRLNSRIRPLPDSKPYRPDLDFGFGSPNFQVGSPSHLSRNGRPYQQAGTSEGALQLNYTPTPALTFTSVTGFNRVATQDGGRAPVGPQAGGFADVYGTFIKRDISQELRVASNFTDSKINFLAGVFVARSRSYYETYLALPTFTLYTNDTIRYFNNTESAFGQILYNPIKEVEISGGLRYTKVREGLKSLFNKDNYPDSGAAAALHRGQPVPGSHHQVPGHTGLHGLCVGQVRLQGPRLQRQHHRSGLRAAERELAVQGRKGARRRGRREGHPLP
jgi:iron complex outermembrane receptor protein